MAVQDYKINYKSDFVLNINGDAGWAIPFCIKFWTGMPSQAYFVGFDGVKYVNCRVGDTPTQLLVMFDNHHLPIGKLEMQIAYHTTIEEFPGSVFDEVTNARDVIVTIDGTDYQVLLDFTGEDTPELEFNLPAYANEAERIQNELQRQQNEAARIAAELQREQATAAAVQGAENVNAQLNGTTLTVTNRQGVSTSVNTKGEQGERGPVGPEGPQGEQGVSIVSFLPKSETSTTLIYTITYSNGYTQDVAIPKGTKGDTGATGPTGPQGDTGVSITGFIETGETETATLYNITFSNGTTQAVAIPKGEKGDQGPQGPVGPQGPMGDVAVITPEQQAAFTMYSVPGQHTNGPMTQKAVTDNFAGIGGTSNDADLDISDDAGNALVRFFGGHVQTKYFDSQDLKTFVGDSDNADLDINDEDDNTLVRFSGGHIKTKYFDSRSVEINTLFNTLRVLNHPLHGKKVGFLGDSITYGYGLPESVRLTARYSSVLCNLIGCTEVNMGVSGTCIASNTLNNRNDTRFVTRVTQANIGDLDFLFVFGGTNDFSYDTKPIGEHFSINTITPPSNLVGSTQLGAVVDTDTFSGGLHDLILAIRAINPNLPMCFLAPLSRGRYLNGSTYTHGGVTYSGARPSIADSNINGNYLYEFEDAIVDITRFYAIPSIRTCSFFNNRATDDGASDLFQGNGDNIHLTVAGNERLAKLLFNWTMNNIVI